MSWTKNDREYLEGFASGYNQALEDLRAELLENRDKVPIEVFENINKLKKENEQ